jgi:hypothetical protein
MDIPAAPGEIPVVPTTATPTLAPPEKPTAPAEKPANSKPVNSAAWAKPVVVSDDQSGTRLWTDVSGQYHVEARLVSFDGQVVHLQKSDGRYVRIALEKLSTTDRRLVPQAAVTMAAR